MTQTWYNKKNEDAIVFNNTIADNAKTFLICNTWFGKNRKTKKKNAKFKNCVLHVD